MCRNFKDCTDLNPVQDLMYPCWPVAQMSPCPCLLSAGTEEYRLGM